ncbi:HxlR family transcriptional regulator [Actinoplanes sp. NBRC 103695]|nr:HxlR family transcriptional regulator [Actinoplanes sp. NBRC 103695]
MGGMIASVEQTCALRRDVLGHVGNKWTGLLLTVLAKGPQRYSELHQGSRISERMLSLTLRELIRDGLVLRDAQVYRLTDAGRSLHALVAPLVEWADAHQEHIVGSRVAFDSGAE